MLLRRATFHNIGPFKHWTLDVEHLRGVIALVAPNGSGKSAAVEMALLGVPHREMKTQGTLKGRATARDAYAKSEITYGAPYTITQFVDPVSKSAGESLVQDASGAEMFEGTKVSTYDEWAARTLPDNDVYTAGPFCAQKDDGLISMGSASRIGIVLRAIGVSKLERMAKLFGKRASKASDAFQALGTRIADASAGATTVEAAEQTLVLARATAGAADEAVAAAKLDLASRQQHAADHAVNKASRLAAEKHLATLTEQRDAAAARVKATEQALAAAQLVVADAAAIRAAAAQLTGEESALAELRAAYATAEAGVRSELDPWRDGAARLKAAEQRRAAALARLKDADAVRAADAAKAGLAARVDAERVAVAALEAERKSLASRDKVTDTKRIEGLRLGLAEIRDLAPDLPDGHNLPSRMAGARLAFDDEGIAAAIALPKELAELESKLSTERDHLAAAERELGAAEKLAARLAELDQAKVDVEAAEREAGELRSGHAVAVISALARALCRLELASAGVAKAAALAPIRKEAARLAELAAAEARLVELEKQGFTDQAEALRLTAQIAEIDAVEGAADLGEPPDVAGAERAVASAEAAAREAAAAVTRAEQALARAQETATRVAALQAERDAVAADLADLTRLELDFGRKGIQSAEVDSAGPELTELANDLLHQCHGPQFTVMVQTQRLDADGKKLIEECNIRVIDSVKGTEKDIEEHSGGELVLLGVAMRLALAMLSARRSGITDFTIVCDEGGAALDPTNNRAFLAMLRRAIAITGARHVLLVSHSEEVQKMCDHIIEIPAAA